jgi:tetraacyldisaccharide 4'-kinase
MPTGTTERKTEIMTVSFKAIIRESWEEDRIQSGFRPLRVVLKFLSLPYRGGVAARNHLYDLGLLPQVKLPCPVIAVGNITAGGTGKTPTVISLANLLRERGWRPAVLSRGYGGRAGNPVNIVSDGQEILMGWREAGDEPILIARAIPGIPVLTGAKRSFTGRIALEQYNANVLLLDDAFQHRQIFRDLDIVLISGVRPFGNGLLLPGGRLREPKASLRRAHVIIRTGAEGDPVEPLEEAASGFPLFRGIHRPKGILEGQSGRLLPVGLLRGEKVSAFAGIGRPETFRRSLIALGAEVVSFTIFPDHYRYIRSDLDTLQSLAKKKGADRIVTTEKDGIRLTDFPEFLTKTSLLRIEMEITPPGPFAELIFSRLAY